MHILKILYNTIINIFQIRQQPTDKKMTTVCTITKNVMKVNPV